MPRYLFETEKIIVTEYIADIENTHHFQTDNSYTDWVGAQK